MGAVPVQMPVTEMYTGLSTGTIDGTYATYNNMTPPWNFWDVATYFVDPEHRFQAARFST